MWDLKCLASALCFLASNALFIVHGVLMMREKGSDAHTANANDGNINGGVYGSDNAYDPFKEHSPVKPMGFHFEYWKDLDPTYIESRWTDREAERPIMMCAALIGVAAWFWLMVPVVQAAWVLSRGGKRMVGTHLAMASFAICGTIIELLSRLMIVGMTNASQWLAKDFNLDDWDNGDVMGTGWRVLEMIHIVTRGMLLWIDAFESLAFFGITVALHYSVATEPKFKLRRNSAPPSILAESESEGGADDTPGMGDDNADGSPPSSSSPPPQSAFASATEQVPVNPTFSRCFAGFGLFLGLIALVDFVASVLRFLNWKLFGRMALVTEVIVGVVFLPIWLLWLGCQLPQATERFEREQRRGEILSNVGGGVEMTALKGNEREFS